MGTDFFALHHGPEPLLLPNPWDVGSARLLAALGFRAFATTSSGAAAAIGRLDGRLGRDATLAHAAQIVAATDLPVTADLENGFAHDPAGVAATVDSAAATGLAGCSIEDWSGEDVYPVDEAAARIEAASEAAHRGPFRLVLTARADNHIHGRPDLADTVTRLQAYQQAGADVLYAPGLTDLADVRTVVAALDRPVNVLAVPGLPPAADLAAAGVRRISVGGSLAFRAYGAMLDAAREFLAGEFGFLPAARAGSRDVQRLLTDGPG